MVLIETKKQFDAMYELVKELSFLGIKYLRGGIFRAGTYPSHGMGFGFMEETKLIEWRGMARDHGMQVIMEVLDYHPDAMTIYDKYSDCYQIGARQMQNYTLLDYLARKKRPIFLKRNMGATVDEWLGAAEWILKKHKADVILVERGISTFNDHVRWTPDISSIPAIKTISPGMPVIIDACHSTGRSDLVEPMTLAGIAAGASGFLCEIRTEDVAPISDSEQVQTIEELAGILAKVKRLQAILKIPYEKDKP